VKESKNKYNFRNFFDLDSIQKIQDEFSKVTEVASIITCPDGVPITAPSNFCSLCKDIIRKTDIGLANCFKSDAVLGKINNDGPKIQSCLSGGLMDAGTSILVGDRHVGNWLIGQVLDEACDIEEMMDYANTIGTDTEEYKRHLKLVKRMPRGKFEEIANLLFLLAKQIGDQALLNYDLGFKVEEILKREELIRESEERYKGLHEASFGGVVIHEQGLILDCNEGLSEITGYSRDELIGMDGLLLIHPDSLDTVLKNIKCGYSQRYEVAGVRKNGERYPLSIRGKNISYKGREVRVIEFRDITDINQAETKLRKAERTQKAILENINSVVTIIDEEGFVRFKSPNIEKFFGWMPEDIVNHSAWDNIYPEDLTRVQAFFVQLLNGDFDSGKIESRYLRKDGSYKWVEFNALNRLNDETINGVLVSYHDISSRKQTEKALIESEKRFKEMFVSHDAVMFIVEPHTGEILDANKAACSFYGYPISEFKTLTIDDINTLPPDKIKLARKNAAEGKINYFEFKHRLANGEIRNVEVHSSPIQLDKQKLLFSIIHDSTERKRLMEERQRSAQLAALGTVAAGVAHEINNPIQGIMNYAQLIQDRPEDKDRVHAFARKVIGESERIAKITQDLLYYSKDTRKEMSQVDLKEVIEGALSLIGTKTKQQNVNIEVNVQDNLGKVLVNPQSIQQIIINLVDNAAAAIEMKDPFPDKKIVLIDAKRREEGPTPFIQLQVQDNGVGMSPEVVEKAQDAFFTTKSAAKGTGLGLSIVRDIVLKHDGELEIDSQEGAYTIITIRLPV